MSGRLHPTPGLVVVERVVASNRLPEVLEGQIDALRGRRDEMENDAYLEELQSLLLELALVQREIDEARAGE